MALFNLSEILFSENELISTQSINRRLLKIYNATTDLITNKNVTEKKATTTSSGVVKLAQSTNSPTTELSVVTFDTLHQNTLNAFLYPMYNTTQSSTKTTITPEYTILSNHSHIGNDYIVVTGNITWNSYTAPGVGNSKFISISDTYTQMLSTFLKNQYTSFTTIFLKVGTSGKHPFLISHPTIFQNTNSTLIININAKSYDSDITFPFSMIIRGIS